MTRTLSPVCMYWGPVTYFLLAFHDVRLGLNMREVVGV